MDTTFSVPQLIGIVNLTPDSFSDGGEYLDPARAVEHALKLAADGADILDLGAESTRPGSTGVPANLQLQRLLPVVKSLRTQTKLPLSIDTTSAEVAATCLAEGASMINDISALRADPQMLPLLVKSHCSIVLMHMKGTPATMQINPQYANVVADIMDFFRERLAICEAAGISRERLILDPGFGFGKTFAHHLELLENFKRFTELGCPVLAGISRKGFLGEISGEREPASRDRISTALALDLAIKGAAYLRVHNVAMHAGALKVLRVLGHR